MSTSDASLSERTCFFVDWYHGLSFVRYDLDDDGLGLMSRARRHFLASMSPRSDCNRVNSVEPPCVTSRGHCHQGYCCCHQGRTAMPDGQIVLKSIVLNSQKDLTSFHVGVYCLPFSNHRRDTNTYRGEASSFWTDSFIGCWWPVFTFQRPKLCSSVREWRAQCGSYAPKTDLVHL